MSLLMNACFVGNRKKENDIYLTTFFSVSCATLLFVFLFFFLMFLLTNVFPLSSYPNISQKSAKSKSNRSPSVCFFDVIHSAFMCNLDQRTMLIMSFRGLLHNSYFCSSFVSIHAPAWGATPLLLSPVIITIARPDFADPNLTLYELYYLCPRCWVVNVDVLSHDTILEQITIFANIMQQASDLR